MKKIKVILAAVLVMASTATFAQKGNFFFGGDLNVSLNGGEKSSKVGNVTTKVDAPDVTNFGIDLSANYFITDNLALGLGVGYSYYDNKISYTNPSYELNNPKTGIFSVVPQLHYVTRLTDRIYWTPGLYLNFGFGSSDVESHSTNVTVTTTSNYFGFKGEIRPLSFDFHATKNIAINFTAGSLYYNMTKWSDKDVSDNYVSDHTFGLSLNNGFTFGFRYYL